MKLDPIAVLPPEISLQILSYLDVATIATSLQVTKSWNELCKDHRLWQLLLLANNIEVYGRTGHYVDWHNWYKQRMRLDRNWRTGCAACFQLPHKDHPIEGHVGPVYAVQISGNYLVSGSSDTSIRIWDLSTERLVNRALLGHGAEVLCLQFDPTDDADLIVSGSKNAEIIVWSFSSAKPVTIIHQAHDGAVTSVRFDRKYMVTSSADQTIKIWDYESMRSLRCRTDDPSPQPLTTLIGHEGGVSAIDFFGDRLVSVSADNTVKVWSISKGICLATVEESRSIACVKFDGGTIVLGGREGAIALYNENLEPLGNRLYYHTDLVRAIQYQRGGGFTDVIVSGSYDGSVVLWTRSANPDWHPRALAHASFVTKDDLRDGLHPARRDRQKQSESTDRTQTRISQDARHAEASPDGRCDVSIMPTSAQSSTAPLVAAEQDRMRASVIGPTHTPCIFGVDFDCRRIVCCSERSVIKGWDFANNDSEIVAISLKDRGLRYIR